MTPALAYHRLADMFPLMEGAEFDSLVNDISEHGLAEPITLLHNLILDGRNRYLALCQLRATCSPETDPHFFDSYKGDDPLQFVISKNLQRRHLNDPQRAWVAVQIANMRQGERTDLPSANVRKVSQADAAKQASISIRAVQMAKRVHETGVHELVGALKGGKIATSTAADLAELPIDEQRRILAAATAPDVPDMSRFVRTAVQQFRRAEREQE